MLNLHTIDVGVVLRVCSAGGGGTRTQVGETPHHATAVCK